MRYFNHLIVLIVFNSHMNNQKFLKFYYLIYSIVRQLLSCSSCTTNEENNVTKRQSEEPDNGNSDMSVHVNALIF